MAYAGDCVEVSYDLAIADFHHGQLTVQCWDGRTSFEIETPLIEYASVGGKIMFPVVYNFHSFGVDIGSIINFDVCTHQSSLSLAYWPQASNGQIAVIRVNALRVKPGDNCIELVLTDALRGDIFADFMAAPAVGTAPMIVQFLNMSDSLQGIDHYLWTFGDGTRSQDENPVHTYERIGKFSVSLTVYGPDGQDTIRKFEYVIAERQFMKRCLHYGVAEEHGKGWAIRSGDNWIWPESQASILTIINNNYRQEIVFDENDGLPYNIDTRDGPLNSGLTKVFRDKCDPHNSLIGSVINWSILFGEYTGELEQYFVEMLETYLSLRPIKPESINASGFDANGLPTTLIINYDLYRDGQLVPYTGATRVPVSRDIVVNRKLKGNAIQIELSGTSTEFKLRKIELSLKVSDFAHNNTPMTELTYQEVLSNPVMWFTRGTNMIDRTTGAAMFNSSGFVGNVEGPDGVSDSAFRIAGTLDVRNSVYAGGTLLLWHKAGYTIDRCVLVEIGQSGDWILSYCYGVPVSLLFTNGDVFDIRIFSEGVTLAAMTHYFENVSEHQGDMYLP